MRRSDTGSVNIIIVGFAVIVLMLLAVVVSASRVFLTQRDLVASADAAASSAAQAVSEAAIFGGGGGGAELPIDPAGAESRVRDYVIAADLPARFDDFAVTAVVVDGTSVTVTLAARSPMPFGSLLSADWADGYPVAASATARSPFTF